MTTPINLFADVPTRLPDELVTILLEAAGLRLERIVSHGHSTTPDTWYDQNGAEWVMILKGAARLRFEGDEHHVELNVGDVVNIPARKRHRVEWTTPDEPTLWLAVHYGERQ